MQDLWNFVTEFWRTFISKVTGGVLAAFLTVWGFYVGHAPPSSVLWGSLTVYFSMSAFGMWRKERHRAISAEAALGDKGIPLKTVLFPSDARRRANTKASVDGLSDRARSVLDEIMEKGSAQWLTAGIGHSDPWGELVKLGLIEKGRDGRCTIRPSVSDDLKAIYDEKMQG
jgi:hypothetical protein